MERRLSELRRETSPEHVHRFRTSLRRLEAVVELTGTPLAPKLAKALHKTRRRTCKVRDCDVHLGLLAELHLGPELPERRELRQAIAQSRERQQRRLERALASPLGTKLARRLRRLRRGWMETPPKLPASPAIEARRRYQAAARKKDPLEPDGLHAARKLAKQLRYMAELDRGGPEARATESALRRLQNALGAWHDWAELSDFAAAHEAGPALMAALRNITGAKLQQALRQRTMIEEKLLHAAGPGRRPAASAPAPRLRRAAAHA